MDPGEPRRRALTPESAARERAEADRLSTKERLVLATVVTTRSLNVLVDDVEVAAVDMVSSVEVLGDSVEGLHEVATRSREMKGVGNGAVNVGTSTTNSLAT